MTLLFSSNSVIKTFFKNFDLIAEALVIIILSAILSLIQRPFLVITARYLPSVVYRLILFLDKYF